MILVRRSIISLATSLAIFLALATSPLAIAEERDANSYRDPNQYQNSDATNAAATYNANANDMRNSASNVKNKSGKGAIANAMAGTAMTMTSGIMIAKGTTLLSTAGQHPIGAKWLASGIAVGSMAVLANRQAGADRGAYDAALQAQIATQCGTSQSCFNFTCRTFNTCSDTGTPTPTPTDDGTGGSGGGSNGRGGPAGGGTGINSFTTDDKNLSNQVRNAMNLAKKNLAELKSKGIYFDEKSGQIVTPKGNINPASLGSTAGMQAAGFSPEAIAKVNEAVAEANAKGLAALQKLDKLNLSDGGSSMAGDGSGGGADGEFDPNAYLKKLQAMGANKDKTGGTRGVAGLSKQVGDSLIGVAGDNIFDMIKRAYLVKAKQGSFKP